MAQTGRCRRVFVLAVVVAVAVAGCDESSESPDRAGEVGASKGTRVDTVPPRHLTPVPEGFEAGHARAAWRLERVEADDRTLVVRVAHGGCSDFSHMTIDAAGPDGLALTAWNRELRSKRRDLVCTAELRTGPFRVYLPEPVAGRPILGQCVARPLEEGGHTPADRICDALGPPEDDGRRAHGSQHP